MTLRQIAQEFNECYMPKLDKNDKPMVNESFSYFTDNLCRDGRITDSIYNRITYNIKTGKCRM